MYELIKTETPNKGVALSVKRTDDDGTIWHIPVDEANADYQAYLAWKAEQETTK